MAASLARAAPVRFLIGVTLAWTTARGVTLVGWSPSLVNAAAGYEAPAHSIATIPASISGRNGPVAMPFRPLTLRWTSRNAWYPPLAVPTRRTLIALLPSARAGVVPGGTMMLAAANGANDAYRRASGFGIAAVTLSVPPSSKRWSGSAWAFLRGGGHATALSPGQVGGGQAGARVLYRIDRAGHLSVSARVSAAIGGARQTEAAVGLDWKPIASLPVHLMAERRIAIDRGGRNAFTLGAAGGVDDVHIAPGWRLDAYGEAGVVGARRRDLYADGAARIARAIDLGGGASLAVGGGVWGAAQPGASRLDIGPSVVLRLPIEHHAVAVALDWRQRALGEAKPGSGVALTVATDF